MDETSTPDSKLTLSQVVNKLLTHLSKEEIGPADRLSKEWFANGGTTEGATELDLKRWQLTQELLDVAWSIPLPITAALASGIDANDPATAVPALQAIRTKNVEGATAASKVLSAKAPGIYPYVTGALDAPAAKPKVTYNAPYGNTSFAAERAPYYGFSSSERVGSGSRWGIGGTIGVIAIFLVRCAAFSARTDSYSYHPSYDFNNDYNYTPPNYDTDQLLKNLEHSDDTTPTPDPYATPDVPRTPPDPPELSSKDPDDLYDDMSTSIGAFFYTDVATEKQQDVVSEFESAMLDRDCKRMRTQMALLEKAPNLKKDETDYPGLAKNHVKALRTRVNLVCPSGGAKKAAPKPAAPPADPEAVPAGT